MKIVFNYNCNHDWHITHKSNIVQLDDMGYPLMLCIVQCEKCGKYDQQWIDVSKKVLDDENIKVLEWEELNNEPN